VRIPITTALRGTAGTLTSRRVNAGTGDEGPLPTSEMNTRLYSFWYSSPIFSRCSSCCFPYRLLA